jgi:hypothetical protein
LINFNEQAMEVQDEITYALWEYIDGICDEPTQHRIAALIAADATWKSKYEELLALNNSLSAGLELEEPSIRFTKNVMDIIAQTNPVPSVRRYINPVIIKSIAAFLLVSIAVTTLFAFFSAGGGAIPAREIPIPKMQAHVPDIANFINTNTITVLLCVNVVLGLLFLDTILRRKARHFHK